MRKLGIPWRHVAPIVLSIAAVAISAVGLYVQSLYGSASLSAQLTGFSIEKRGTDSVCVMDVALFNSGNRDTALLQAGLRQGRTAHAGHDQTSSSFAEYFADSSHQGYVNTVVKGGDIKLLTLVFLGCRPSNIEPRLKSGGLDHFTLETDAVNYDGKRSHVSTDFATASSPASGSLVFVLHLGGQFDLLKDGALYTGTSKGSTETITIDKDGTIHTDTTASSD